MCRNEAFSFFDPDVLKSVPMSFNLSSSALTHAVDRAAVKAVRPGKKSAAIICESLLLRTGLA